MSTLLAFTAAMPNVGFELPLVALILAWMRFFGAEGWLFSVTVAACTTCAFYLLFIVVLELPIPHLL